MDEDFLHPLEATQRQRRVILSVIRVTFAVLILTIAALRAAQSTAGLAIEWWIPVIIAVVFFAVALSIDLLTPNKKISTISSVFLGLLGGMLATVAFGVIIDLLIQTAIEEQQTIKELQPFVSVLKMMLGLTLCYLGVTTVIQTQDDFRLVIPYVEFSKQLRGPRPLILDTSSLIDARVVDVAATGLIQSPIVVPRFVVGELQTLADSADKLKRARGRRGLDVTARLQRSGLDVTIDETPTLSKGVDQMLVDLARRVPGTIVTADVGLARVAQIQNVPVLNLNDVANALKPSLIPGEQISLRLIKGGEQPGQAVGYLADGTMVVVERSAHRMGDEAVVQVSSSLQTSAGRLIFAKLADEREDGTPIGNPSDRSRSGVLGAGDSRVLSIGDIAPTPESTPDSVTSNPVSGPNLLRSDSAVHSLPQTAITNETTTQSSGSEPLRSSVTSSEDPTPTSRRAGPFPPKPGSPRSTSARNPRR